MAIIWNKLRVWNGSIEKAFEELCCQLAGAELPQIDARFFRKGIPDAGVECFWQLPNGHEWGWQAKWFRSSPTSNQWQQIDNSVKQALEKHPHLTKLTICLPIDRSDARLGKQKSFLEKWNNHVDEWEKLAAKKGMAVSFEYWGESEIGGYLSDEQHRGRHWFWFNEECLTTEWFKNRVEETVANARDRYLYELNIDLPIRENFDATGRTGNFFKQLECMYSDIQVKLDAIGQRYSPSLPRQRLDHILAMTQEMLSRLEKWAIPCQEYDEWSMTQPIPWENIGAKAKELIDSVNDLIHELYGIRSQREKNKDDGRKSEIDGINFTIYNLREFEHAISEIACYSRSNESQLSNAPAMLLVGEAGQGKTHLFCHTDVPYAWRARG